ncbi:hypothetical protein [Streptomyces sp. LaPpAH-108]|uniref:hypothetical protein n=1 Tax=Streptomyces sp. LaPpAH-108 TaxID=1155714 RepID=UPI000372256A|nr:hypothetical protein [Streptomyces sp. LaPpAH-108]
MGGLGDGAAGGAGVPGDGTGGGADGFGHERLAALCDQLTTSPGTDDLDPPVRLLMEHITSEVRGGRPPGELEEDFDELEDLLLASGLSAGLGSYRTDGPPPYQRFPATGPGHPPLHFLTCPRGRCARVEAPPSEGEGRPACRIFGEALRETGLRRP